MSFSKGETVGQGSRKILSVEEENWLGKLSQVKERNYALQNKKRGEEENNISSYISIYIYPILLVFSESTDNFQFQVRTWTEIVFKNVQLQSKHQLCPKKLTKDNKINPANYYIVSYKVRKIKSLLFNELHSFIHCITFS